MLRLTIVDSPNPGLSEGAKVFRKPVDRRMGTLGLLLFELDGACDDFLGSGPGMAQVLAALACEGKKSSLPDLVEFAPEG